MGFCAGLQATLVPPIELTQGGVYRENFDGMVAAGDSGCRTFYGEAVPEGWSLLTPTPGPGAYRLDNGRRMASGYYSYGSRSSRSGNTGDRALGTLHRNWGRSRDLAFGATFENSAALPLQGVQIQFYGEEWRLTARGVADRLNFQYSTDAHSLSDGTWVDFDGLDVVSMNLQRVGPTDGNAAQNRQLLEATLPLTVAAGSTFWIRWVDGGDVRRGSGLAVDDFSMTPFWESCDITPVPEAGAFWGGAGLLGLVLLGLRSRVRCGTDAGTRGSVPG